MKAWILAAALASISVAGCGERAQSGTSTQGKAHRGAHAETLGKMSGVWSGDTAEMAFIAPDGAEGVHFVVDSKLFATTSVRLKVVGYDQDNKIISMMPVATSDPSAVWSLRLAEQSTGGAKTYYPLLIGQRGELVHMKSLMRKLLPSDLQHMANIEAELQRKAAEAEAAKSPRCPGVDVSTTAGLIECEEVALAAAQAALSRAQDAAMAKATPDRATELQSFARAFAARTDAECSPAKLESDDLGGSNLDLAIIGCKLRAVQQRTAELAAGR